MGRRGRYEPPTAGRSLSGGARPKTTGYLGEGPRAGASWYQGKATTQSALVPERIPVWRKIWVVGVGTGWLPPGACRRGRQPPAATPADRPARRPWLSGPVSFVVEQERRRVEAAP